MTFKHNNVQDYHDYLDTNSSVSMFDRKVVIFHHSDVDGAFAAASILDLFSTPHAAFAGKQMDRKTEDFVTIKPVNYGSFKDEEILELVHDKDTDVFIVDFAFPAELSDAIAEKAGFFVVLDHHKTNAANLEGKPYGIFDMTASGALMAWQWVSPSSESHETPLAITLADNRDMWKKTDGREDAFHESIMSIRSEVYGFKNWDTPLEFEFIYRIRDLLWNNGLTESLCENGALMLVKRDSNIQSVCQDKNLFHTVIGGHPAVVVNYPVDQSDACEYLYSQEKYKDKIAACASFKDGKTVFSLRKNAELDVDLSQIAEIHYGGGGHRDAAGFAVSMERGVKILGNKEKWALCWPAGAVDLVLQDSEATHISKDMVEQLIEIPEVMRSRAVCETDTSMLQILPYLVLINQKNEVLLYTRPNGGTETRLHDKYSVGLGGHVDTLPGEHSLACHLGKEAARELMEEAGVSQQIADAVSEEVEYKFNNADFSIIRLRTGPVEEVHIGLAFRIDVHTDWIDLMANPEEVQDARWVHYSKLPEYLTRFVSSGGYREIGKYEAWTDTLIKLDPSFFA